MRLAIPLAPAPGTRIEAAIDRGNIRAAEHERTVPIREIELGGLKDGPATAASTTSRSKLLDIAPLRLETRSKAERGYRLAAKLGRSAGRGAFRRRRIRS